MARRPPPGPPREQTAAPQGGRPELSKDSPATVEHNGWKLLLASQPGEEPRIRDLDLARKLGYAHTHDIRKLIARLEEEGKLRDIRFFATVAKNPDGSRARGRAGKEYHLTRNQALKVAAHSATDIADALLDEMIVVFEMALDGKLQAPKHPRVEMLDRFLLQDRVTLDRLFEPHFISVICLLYGTSYQAGDHAPVWFKGFVGRLYRLMLGEDVHLEMKARGNSRDLYEYLTPDALRLVRSQMDFVTGIARQCRTPAELSSRLRTYFNHEGFQFALELEDDSKKGKP